MQDHAEVVVEHHRCLEMFNGIELVPTLCAMVLPLGWRRGCERMMA